MRKSKKKSVWAIMVTQCLGAFNDNVLKVLVTLLTIFWIQDTALRDQWVDLSGVVFVAPFLLFSMIAGRVSDRLGKPHVVVLTKWWELLVVAAAVFIPPFKRLS